MILTAPRSRQDFEIAILCALTLEASAVISLFDQHWEDEEDIYGKGLNDPHAYTTGVIGKHNVVVAHMSSMGKVNAGGVAVSLRMSFPNIKLALVVGICGGVPYGPHHRRDIYLGDVVISQYLVQYDFGRQYPRAFEVKNTLDGAVGMGPVEIQSLLRKLATDHHTGRLEDATMKVLQQLQGTSGRTEFPGAECDVLFKPDYIHRHHVSTDCGICGEEYACADAMKASCHELECAGGGGDGLVPRERSINRSARHPTKGGTVGIPPPSIHIGKMGSGDTVMKSGTHRDETARKDGIIAFEMEGAGVSVYLPSLVIKGVCDYADSHKNKEWQRYAATTAAACTKAFLNVWNSESCYGDRMGTWYTGKQIFMVHLTGDTKLIGRQDDMKLVTEKLSMERRHNRAALVALGGIGKTRIALEYASRFKNSQVSVFWIHSSTKEQILEGYAKIAKEAKIIGYTETDPVSPLLVKRWLEGDASGRWLMVLDNADDHDVLYGPDHLVDLFPRSDNGSILMTTRDKRVGLNFAGPSRLLLLQPLNSGQAQELLVASLGVELGDIDKTDLIDRESCMALCDELCGIPLAIVQASAYMQDNTISADGYLDLYRGSSAAQIDLLSHEFEDTVCDRECKNAVATTWFISFDHIHKKETRLASELLKRMSIVDSQAIPISLIRSQEPDHELVKALGRLQAFCLITRRKFMTGKQKIAEQTYDMHRLVRLAMRNWLTRHQLLYPSTAGTLKIVSANYPDVETTGWSDMDRSKAYLPHAITLLTSSEIKRTGNGVALAFRNQHLVNQHLHADAPCAACAADLMMKLSLVFTNLEDYKNGITWGQEAIALRTFVFGENHLLTAGAVIQTAAVLYSAGRIETAKGLCTKALQVIEASTDPPLALVAWKYDILGFLQLEDGKNAGRLGEHFSKALEIRLKALGPDHPDTIRTKINLSAIYDRQCRYKDAESLLIEAVETLTRTAGPESPGTVKAKANLALQYSRAGEYEQAVALNAEISELQATMFGAKHPQTINTLPYSAGGLLRILRTGRYTQEAELCVSAVKLSTEFHGLDSVQTHLAIAVLSRCYKEAGNITEAQKLMLKTTEAIIELGGDGASIAITSMRLLAEYYDEWEMYKEAQPLWERIVEFQTEKLGRNDPETILSMCVLGINYTNQGLHDKAAEYQYRALNYPLNSLEAKIPDNITVMADIALKSNLNGNLMESERVASDAVMLARQYGSHIRIQLVSSLTSLAAVYSTLNKSRKAEELFKESLAIMGSQSEDEENIAFLMTQLACVYLQEARYKEAESIALEAKMKLSNLAKPSNWIVITNMRTLANAYTDQGRYWEGEIVIQEILFEKLGLAWKANDMRISCVAAAAENLECLARMWCHSERYLQAEKVYEKTIAVRQRVQGTTSSHTLKLMVCYIDTFNAQRRYTEALILGLDCKALYKRKEWGNTSPEQLLAASIDNALAASYLGLGRFTNAEPLARQSLETISKNLGGNHPESLNAWSLLARILRERDDGMRNLLEVNEMEVHVLSEWTKLVGECHLKTIAAMEALAQTSEKMGDGDKAFMLRETAKVLRVSLGPSPNMEGRGQLVDLLTKTFQRLEDTTDRILGRKKEPQVSSKRRTETKSPGPC